MSDWDPRVVRITRVESHPNADALDVVTVLNDYPVVVKRGDYKLDDVAAYIPIDTVVPDSDTFYFLCPVGQEKYEENGEIKHRPSGPKYALGSVPEKYRIIKAKKIRGTYSQGMLMPCPEGLKESDSVAQVLGLKKWEEQEEENLPGMKITIGAEDPPKGWEIPHYDIVGIRKFVDSLQEGEEIVLTEKLHGSNAAFVHDGARLWVKSRNFYREMDAEDLWWGVAQRYDLESKLKQVPNKIFFGEVYGVIKGFRYDTAMEGGRVAPRVRFFDVFDLASKRYLDFDQRVQLLGACGLDAVPVLYRGPWLGRDAMYAYAEGATTLGGGKHVREGWVLVPSNGERFDPAVRGRMQVKLVGQGYNLQK